MNRRATIRAIAGWAAAGSSLPAMAQPGARVIRIGMVETIASRLNEANLAAFRRGLEDLGYAEGRNYLIEYRSADGDAARYPALIAELLALKVDLLVTRGTPAALAAKAATGAVPVVMAGLGDPLLVVESLARPGGNLTGLSGLQPLLEGKRLAILLEMAPKAAGIVALLNRGNPVTDPQVVELGRAVAARGLRLRVIDVRNREDIERAFGEVDAASDAMVVGLEALTQAHRGRIAELAAERRVPAIYGGREFVEAGGLIFYGPSFTEMYRRAATYVDRIVRGQKPADLPIEQPMKFELIVNGRAAKALGLDIPASLQLLADEVLE